MIDFWLLIAKYGFLGLLYAFVLWIFIVIIRGRASSDVQVAPNYKIKLLSDKSGSKEHLLSGVISIGRSRDNEIWLSDDTVSNYHVTISFLEGFWVIEDLGSKNGTYVNQEKILARRRIFPGDSIKIGRNELIVVEG